METGRNGPCAAVDATMDGVDEIDGDGLRRAGVFQVRGERAKGAQLAQQLAEGDLDAEGARNA